MRRRRRKGIRLRAPLFAHVTDSRLSVTTLGRTDKKRETYTSLIVLECRHDDCPRPTLGTLHCIGLSHDILIYVYSTSQYSTQNPFFKYSPLCLVEVELFLKRETVNTRTNNRWTFWYHLTVDCCMMTQILYTHYRYC